MAAPRIKPVQHRRDSRFKATQAFLAEIIKEGVERGEFRSSIDPDSAALMLLALADGLSLDWATTNVDFDWKALAKDAKTLFTEGLLNKWP